MINLRYIFVVIILVCFCACEKKSANLFTDYQYFPLAVGQYQIYEVYEVKYSLSQAPSISKSYLKEQISNVNNSSNQQKHFTIERYKRISANQPWQIDSVWTGQLYPNKAIRTENNIAFVKLIFPIQISQFWNKNELNSLPEQMISYKTRSGNFQIDDKNYTNVISVVIKNDSSLLSKQKNIEIYAPKFGMIYLENANLSYCQSSPDCIGKNIIEYGFERKMKLIEFGNR